MIVVNGHEFITLDDDFYVNGKKVYEAKLGTGDVVYPRHIGGRYAKVWGKTNANCRLVYSDEVPWRVTFDSGRWGIHDSSTVDYAYSAGFVSILTSTEEFYVDGFYTPLGDIVGGDPVIIDGKLYNGYPLNHSPELSYWNPSPIAYGVSYGKALESGLTIYEKHDKSLPYYSHTQKVFAVDRAYVYKNANGFPHAPDYYMYYSTVGKFSRIEPKSRTNFSLPVESGRIYQDSDNWLMANHRAKPYKIYGDTITPAMGNGFWPVGDRLTMAATISCDITERVLKDGKILEDTITNYGVEYASIPIKGVRFYNERPQIDDDDYAYLESI